MRKYLPSVLLLLSACAGSVAGTAKGLPARFAPRNEISPREDLWVKSADGLQRQIALPEKRIKPSETALAVVLWVRNPTDHPLSIRTIAPPFSLHGDLAVRDGDGTEIVVGECKKKHAYQELTLAAGEVRGFFCDAFDQPCFRRRPGDLPAGRYEVRMAGTGGAAFEVGR